MKQKSAKIFVEDILGAISKIERYTQGMVYDAFFENERTVDAVIRNLEIIGEAARNIPKDLPRTKPKIESMRSHLKIEDA